MKIALISILFTGLFLLGIFQTLIYVKLKKTFNQWPIVVAEITYTRLLNQLGANGENIIEAIIYFKYTHRGKEYESRTPLLKGYDIFPSLEYQRVIHEKYTVGELYNARVHPLLPKIACLEVCPLSKASVIAAPILSIGSVALFIGYVKGTLVMLGL